MKHKKLIIWTSCIVGVVIVLSTLVFTLFRTKNINLNFQNHTTIFSSKEKQEQIIDSSKISNNKLIFAVNKSKAIKNLELENSYLKVINIETKFPNSLVIHCAEREELFCIKSTDELYYICDEEFKILSQSQNPSFGQNNALILSGVTILNPSAQSGEFLEIADGQTELSSLANLFKYFNKTIADIKGMFKSVELSYKINFFTKKNSSVLTFTTYDNFIIEIDAANTLLKTKIQLLNNLLPNLVKYYKTHKLVIDIDTTNKNKIHTILEELTI